MSLTWDHPDADPIGDIKTSLQRLWDTRYDPKVFLCPVGLAAAWEAEYGRPMTDRDVHVHGFDKVAFA